jgi:hypothetical protein
MIYFEKIIIFSTIYILIGNSKAKRFDDYYSETTITSDVFNETPFEGSGDRVSVDDYDYKTTDIETNNTNEINLLIDYSVEKLFSFYEKGAHVKVEKRNHTINDTIDYLLGIQKTFSSKIDNLYKKMMPLLLTSASEVS